MMADSAYAKFQRKLVPNVDPDTIVGVRIPDLRRFSKTFAREPEAERFMSDLPHATFEENCLHGILIGRISDFGRAVDAIDDFLPFVDNWAVCDTIAPAAFRRVPDGLEEAALRWASSQNAFEARFGIGVLMRHFLGDRFRAEHAEFVASLESDDHYVNMMRAWYFASALAVRSDDVGPYFEAGRLDERTRRKAIQKALDSRRIPDDLKRRLKGLRRSSAR